MGDGSEVLGTNGEQLEAIAAPLLDKDVDAVDNASVGGEKFFDGALLLADRLSPELAAWTTHKISPRMREDHGTWVAPGCGTLFGASRAEDAWWAIRLQSIFLPVSSVWLRGETYVTASWHPTAFGTSRVYITHQDEPGVWRRHGSLTGLLAHTIASDSDLEIAGETRKAYHAADAAMSAADVAEFPAHLDPEVLQVRTRWIAELLIGQHVTLFDTSNGLYYDRLAGIPSIETYEAERALIADWPHLQAYWLVHHMLLRNRDALAEVLELADDAYPPIPELRHIARAFDDGAEPRQLVTAGVHQALRWDMVRQGLPGMDATVTAAVQAQIDAHDALLQTAEASAQELRKRDDAETKKALAAWDLLGDLAGDLMNAETALLDAWHDDAEERSALGMRVKTGETTPLIRLFDGLLHGVDASWAPLFEAAFTAGATVDEDHADAAPGALVGWGKALGSFGELHERFNVTCKSAGRRRYLELAMVANHFYSDPKSEPFLISEMNDFMGDFGNFERGTMGYALFALLEREHPEAIEAANLALEKAPMNGASWQTLLALFDRVEKAGLRAVVPGLQAAVQRDFGRHDDGTRGQVVRIWARMAGAAALAPLEGMLDDITDVRKTCEEAALLAGLLTADATHGRALERAEGCLGELLAAGGAMEVGAAVALLGAMKDASVPAVVSLAQRALVVAEASEYSKPAQRQWLQSVVAA